MDNWRLKLIPLGGVTDVTKNMYLYELYRHQELVDILIVDCGVGFPREKSLGVDLIIPDIGYLIGEDVIKENKINKIRAILFTHGHEDHISGTPYLYDQLGQPDLYASRLTALFLNNKLEEFGYRKKVNEIRYLIDYQFGNFKVRFINVTHSIPDTTHIFIQTPAGNVYHGADFKFDLTPPYGPPPNFYEITKVGKIGVNLLLSDSLGAEREGLTLSENVVGESFEREMRTTKGKFIMTTFSSNISRIRQCVEVAQKLNRKIAFLGRSMKENTRAAREIGYLPGLESILIKEEQINRYPPNKICLIVAGSQGQFDSALAKISRGDNPNVRITKGDKIIFSSDPIPGNETEVYDLVEELIKKGAEVIYPSISDQLHASGHGNIDDLKFLIRFINPKFFVPIGGTLRHQRQYQRIVKELGYPENSVFLLEEGDSLWIEKNRSYLGRKIETKTVYVDAYGVGDVGNIVLRDRKNLATEGIVVVILTVDNNFRLLSQPRIVTRGFIYEKNEEELLNQSKKIVAQILKPKKEKIFKLNNIKREIINKLEEFYFQIKGRKPLVIVEIINI